MKKIIIISQIKKVVIVIFIISFICMMLLMDLVIWGYIPGTSVLLVLLLPIIAVIVAKIKSKKIRERTDKNEGKNRRD